MNTSYLNYMAAEKLSEQYDVIIHKIVKDSFNGEMSSIQKLINDEMDETIDGLKCEGFHCNKSMIIGGSRTHQKVVGVLSETNAAGININKTIIVDIMPDSVYEKTFEIMRRLDKK